MTFTATVSPASNALYVAAGQVTFLDGTTPLNTINLGPGGKAVFSTQGLTGGPHTITATYTGDANFTRSPPPSNPVMVTVSQGVSSISLVSLSPGVRRGTTVTLQATLNGGRRGRSPQRAW